MSWAVAATGWSSRRRGNPVHMAMRIATAAFAAVALVAPAGGQTAEKSEAAPRIGKTVRGQLFAVIYRPGRNWRPGLPMNRQDLGPHLRYYRQGLTDGHVLAGGGLLAMNGGLAILTMASLADAEAFLASDPAIVSGVFSGEVHAWTPAVMSTELLSR